jgi:Trk K+ transport system NAD-binding subunit
MTIKLPSDISSSRSPDRFLVCGLGSLGEHCVVHLREFGGVVVAIEQHPPHRWELSNLLECLHHLEVGDCRQPDVLRKAGIDECRAVLIVTSNERVNIETALAARALNSHVRLVVRSSQQNLNQLLQQQLENFVAFEPTQLSAIAFALAAMKQNILGLFYLGDQVFRVMKYQVQLGDRWCNIRQIYELNNSKQRVLVHYPASHDSTMIASPVISRSNLLYNWEPDVLIGAGDIIITLEVGQTSQRSSIMPSTSAQNEIGNWSWWQWLNISRLWRLSFLPSSASHHIQQLVFFCSITILGLVIVSTILFLNFYPNIGLLDAFYATAVLLLGGYGDLFSEYPLAIAIPWWLRLFSLSLTLAGTAFVGVLYALLTEKLLASRLQFLDRRPPIPKQHHHVVIGLGRIGRRVMNLLSELGHPVIGILSESLDVNEFPNLPVLSGDITSSLNRVYLGQADSVIAVTEDEMQNLEWGLLAHRVNPNCSLVIRAYDDRFSQHIAKLFPYAQVLCVSSLSANAFAAAAYGENILGLFRLSNHTVLVTEYLIEAGDTLNKRLLSEIAYGYRVVPIAHYPINQPFPRFMPSDDIRLHVGDRLVVLATTDNLQRIEWGDPLPPQWVLTVDKLINLSACFDGATEIACISGCEIGVARTLMAQLPSVLPVLLYKQQAVRLIRALNRIQIIAHAELNVM